MAYCEARTAEIASIFQKNIQAGVRVDPALRAINNACHKTKSMIEQGCQGGHITPQEYAAMLAELMQKDLALVKHFGDEPANQAKVQRCKIRFGIVKKEHAELVE